MFDDLFAEDPIEDVGAPAAENAGGIGGLPPPRENPDMIGNAETEAALISLYNAGTLPHALIFAGPSGVGKATMAFRFARFLLKYGAGADDQDSLFGDTPPPPTSMQIAADDAVFRKVASGGHPDLRYIERGMDERKGTRRAGLDVDTVREIAPFLRRTTAEGGWRVVIVDEADLMNRQSQNALLKILEEPPPKAMLILVCNRPGALIPTIRSRCRTLHFPPLARAALETLIQRAAPKAQPKEIALLAALSDGSIGRAARLHEDEGLNVLQTIIWFLGDWPKWDWPKIHPMAENLARPDGEKGYHTFAALFEWVAAAFLKSCAVGPQTLPEPLRAEALMPLRAHYSLEQWIDICEKLNEHFIAIETSNLDRRQGVIGAFAIMGGK
jgi:DNA polymerase-3 subunit delta'